MWHCQNCGYTDETGDSFEQEQGAEGEIVRYCPECGSDEVFLMDAAAEKEEDEEEEEEEFSEDDEDWDDEEFDGEEEEEEEEW